MNNNNLPLLKDGEAYNPLLFEGTSIPEFILRSKDIQPIGKLILGKLRAYARSNGLAFPSRKTLAADLGISLHQLDRNIKGLKDLGLLRTEQYDLNDPNSPSLYICIWKNKIYTDYLQEMAEKETKKEEIGLPLNPR